MGNCEAIAWKTLLVLHNWLELDLGLGRRG